MGKENFISLMMVVYRRIIGTKIKQEDEVISHAKEIAEWAQNWTKKPWLRIAGFVGNGKTTIISAFRLAYETTNRPRLFPIITADRLAKLAHSDPQEFERIIALPRLIIDDLGTEPGEITSYGNKIRPIVEALMARYCRRALTIYTTNLTSAQFEEQYGERIADRCRELEHKIVFKQEESFRKLNNKE